MTLDYYGTLGVSPGANRYEIRMAFRALALRYHPDVHPDRASAVELFRGIIEAYEVLSNPTKRASYDEWRRIEAIHPGQATFNPPTMGGTGPLFTGG
jgi:curved DNA-binding protein